MKLFIGVEKILQLLKVDKQHFTKFPAKIHRNSTKILKSALYSMDFDGFSMDFDGFSKDFCEIWLVNFEEL